MKIYFPVLVKWHRTPLKQSISRFVIIVQDFKSLFRIVSPFICIYFQRELNAVASTPKCIYMKTVSNYTVLPAINYEIQQLSQQGKDCSYISENRINYSSVIFFSFMKKTNVLTIFPHCSEFLRTKRK